VTDSEIQQLKKGEVIHEQTPGGCRPFTVRTAPRPARNSTHYEVWAQSKSGTVVVRVTYHAPFHRALTHRTRIAKEDKARA
jgi:hypothetical protein